MVKAFALWSFPEGEEETTSLRVPSSDWSERGQHYREVGTARACTVVSKPAEHAEAGGPSGGLRVDFFETGWL